MASKDTHKAVPPERRELPRRQSTKDTERNGQPEASGFDAAEQAILNAHDRGWK